jgi:hypothetical protein
MNLLDKEAIKKRILKYNSENGRVMKAFNKVFVSGVYPVGTNLAIEFIKEFKGMPYGDGGMSLDKKGDCSQSWIDFLYYLFGINTLGSYTESIYNADGKEYKSIDAAPVLSIVLYKLSNRNKHATHAAGKVSSTEIGDTRSVIHPFMIRKYKGWYDGKVTRVVDFLTTEQRESMIVQGTIEDYAKSLPVFKKGVVSSSYVEKMQRLLIKKGFDCGKHGPKDDGVDGDFGKDTESAVKAFQKKNGLPETGVCTTETWIKLLA